MEYRIDKQGLLDRISAWDSFLKRKVHLIACGGTALTLLGVKDSTLEKQFREAASYDVSEEIVIKNWEYFLGLVKKEAA